MAKPLSVVRAALAADEAIRAQYAAEPVAAPADDPQEPQPAPVSLFQVVQNDDPEPQDAPDAPQEPQDEPQGAPDAPPLGESQDYEHRFRVLQGKYKAETARMRDAIAATEARLASTTDLLAAMSARPAPAPAPAPAPEPETSSLTVAPLHQRELDEFGADMLDASSRFTLSRLMPVIDGLRSEVQSLKAQMAQTASTVSTTASTVAMSARERMFATLDDGVPDWRAINMDTEFKEWLAQEDSMSGETRHALLLRAFERNDAARVKRFFVAYGAESAAQDEPATRKPARADQPRAPVPVSPSALVAPGRGRAAPTVSTPPPAEWTPQLIAAFYKDVREGLFRSNPQERERIEADIFAAQREGRVV